MGEFYSITLVGREMQVSVETRSMQVSRSGGGRGGRVFCTVDTSEFWSGLEGVGRTREEAQPRRRRWLGTGRLIRAPEAFDPSQRHKTAAARMRGRGLQDAPTVDYVEGMSTEPSCISSAA